MFQFAESQKVATQAVAIYPGQHGGGTIQQEFLKALMLSVSSTDGLAPLNQEIAERISHLDPRPGSAFLPESAGQYIIPVNDNGAIKGEAVSNPTFEQYQQAVGKVIAIEQDGRARIIVKVA